MSKKINQLFLSTVIGIFFLLMYSSGMCQTPQQALSAIYKTYDSVPYLTFDVKFTYTSDTLYGDFINDVLEGTYTLAGKKTKYNLGDIEFMQNDSFFISVYNKDNFILVADPVTNNAGNNLPMRQVMDSLLQSYSSHYTISNTVIADTGFIRFIATDSVAQFKTFTLTYDPQQNFIQSLRYEFDEMEESDSLPPKLRKKQLKIEFQHYRFDNIGDAAYNENNYIFFEGDAYKPVKKYQGFRLFDSKRKITHVIQQVAQ